MRDRPYEVIAARLSPRGPRDARMRAVTDALWEGLRERGVSWVGFYIERPESPPGERLVLGPCRNKPACSPIGLHGVCGQALLAGRARIVRDVSDLGPDYIACDPADRSEIVIPLADDHGRCWGVLDLDSHEVGAFSDADRHGLVQVLRAAGFSPPPRG
jgi:putative methionine-R-sulfoxide reductase with GAF domain